MIRFVKNMFYDCLNIAGILRLARRRNRDQALILTYHGVLKQSSNSYVNRNCVSTAMFERQMRWLKKHYNILPLSKLLDCLEGKEPLPPYAVAVTFDDGYRNNFTEAFPILLNQNIPATVFLTTDYIGTQGKKLWTEQVDMIIFSSTARRLEMQMNGQQMTFDISNAASKENASDQIRTYLKSQNPDERERKIMTLERQIEYEREIIEEMQERYAFLSWEEVRTMIEGGIEFGSHTVSHSILSTLSPDELEQEVLNSKMAIEAQLNTPIVLFSYPNGRSRDFTKRDQLALKKAGYRAALSQIHGFNRVGDNLYALKRINIVRSRSFSFFLAKVTGVWGFMKEAMGKSA